MEELEKLCENCKRLIAVANYATHSAYCERNMKVCDICKNPYQVSLEKDHLDEYHVVEPCNLCGRPVEKWLLSKHQEICPRRPIQCMFCELSFPFDEYDEHDDFCGSRTEKCLLCQKYIMLKDKTHHTELHRLERTKGKESRSKKELDPTGIHEGASQSSAFKIKASVQSHLLESMARHNPEEVEQNLVNEAISLSSPYERGDRGETAVQLYSRQDKENTNATGNKILKGKRDVGVSASNDSSTGEISKHVTTCHICRQTIRWIDFNTHVPTCATDQGKCSTCGEDVPSGTMKEHLSRCRKVPRGAEAGHPIESKTRNSSSSPQPTVSRNAIYPELSYECPLCCEEVPERDKKKHESFYCKTLLEINMSDKLSSISEYDSSKESQRRQKKLSSECSVPGSGRMQEYQKSEPIQKCKAVSRFNEHTSRNGGSYSSYNSASASNTHIEDYASKGAMPKHSNSSKIMIPKTGKCKFCKTVLNNDILSYHEEQCVHQPIQCSNCNDSIQLKDFEDHDCKWTKSKGKKNKKNNTKSKDSDNSYGGWLTGIFNRSSKSPEDGHENKRNESHPNYTVSRFSQTPGHTTYGHENKRNESHPNYAISRFSQTPGDTNSSPLYFSQPYVDDAKIPCEFCGKLISVIDIVLHETGCNPDEVSFAKKQTAENVEERKAVASQRFGHAHKSSTGNSFFENGTAPSSKKERVKKYQESSVKPGEFLGLNRINLSSQLEDNKSESQSQGGKSSTSTIASVWNFDSSDEEAQPKAFPPESPHEEKSHPVEEDKTVSEGSEEFCSGSDEEVSQMLDFIRNKETEPSEAKRGVGSKLSKSKEDSPTEADEIGKMFYKTTERWKKEKLEGGSKLPKSKEDSPSDADELGKMFCETAERWNKEKLEGGSKLSEPGEDSSSGADDEIRKRLYETIERWEIKHWGKKVEGERKPSKSKHDSLSGLEDEPVEILHEKIEHCKVKVEKTSKLLESNDDISGRMDGCNFTMNQGKEEASPPHGAAVGSQSENPFKEAFDYILNSKEEYLVEERTCWNPSSMDDDERENVKVHLNEDLEVQESLSSACQEDKRWFQRKFSKSSDSS